LEDELVEEDDAEGGEDEEAEEEEIACEDRECGGEGKGFIGRDVLGDSTSRIVGKLPEELSDGLLGMFKEPTMKVEVALVEEGEEGSLGGEAVLSVTVITVEVVSVLRASEGEEKEGE
jgi:hypothetical protein